jgi:LytS/YehU family sensor histidine kinase
MLVVRVTNPCDPDRPRNKLAGFGLSLVRQRLQSQFGLAGQLDIDEQGGEFTAKVSLPFEPPEEASANANA